jgi:hypothetical protein
MIFMFVMMFVIAVVCEGTGTGKKSHRKDEGKPENTLPHGASFRRLGASGVKSAWLGFPSLSVGIVNAKKSQFFLAGDCEFRNGSSNSDTGTVTCK